MGSDGSSIWEPVVDNRNIDLKNINEIEVEDVYGKPNHVKEAL